MRIPATARRGHATVRYRGGLLMTADVPDASQVRVEIVIPVYNEEHVLRQSIETLRSYLLHYFPYQWQITVADNASTDGTWQLAQQLGAEDGRVHALHLDQKGRG